ncbi:MAG: tubulin/FtsZ family protein [Chloroflexi bacterium]|nr:tubulin/FtsZ family protein [Chloroflexota bacterium]
MKMMVVGFGQCGCRIADEFARLNKRAETHRNIQIFPGIYAVNTDAADLSGLKEIKSDFKHRILIGGRKTGGHGVGKINELGAEVAKADADKIVEAVRGARRFYESDAFLLIAGSGGGTGSGSMPIIAKHLKDRYADKPVYCMVVLPFEHEEETEERTIYNTAVCLKSVDSVADAVILVDNQRYLRKDTSLQNNMTKINEMIVEPFFDMLCAGEEQKDKYIGAKTLDAGDIIQTLSGWTAIGYGEAQLKSITLFDRAKTFKEKSEETNKGSVAMDEALIELSMRIDAGDAGRALYLVSGPAREMNMDMIKQLGEWMREIAPNAIIRNGDYPREKNNISVTVVLSELSEVSKVREYYARSTELIPIIRRRQEEIKNKLKNMEESGQSIPSLFD